MVKGEQSASGRMIASRRRASAQDASFAVAASGMRDDAII
jgi:hypothetical protein